MKNNIRQFLFGNSLNNNTTVNIVWLLFRLHIGLSLAINAGLPKIKDGMAPDWFVKQVGEIGFTFISPAFWATLASWGEFIGGICLALGLLTRFSAIQLAFQFFVISFIWYDNPVPVMGMYFQQTLFWGYVLAAFAGGGKYSLDNLIIKRSKINTPAPAKVSFASILILVLSSCNTNAQMKPLNGSGKIINKIYDYKNFDKIEIQDLAGNITVEVGKPFAITATIDDNLAPLLKITESNGELKLQLEGNRSNRLYIEETNIEIKICMPSITAALHSANSKLLIEGINSKKFRIKNNENGTAIIKGIAEELEIVCAGNGAVKATEMVAQKVDVTKRGNGNVYLKTNNSFAAKGSGNGDIINEGNGKADAGAELQGNGGIKYSNEPKVTVNGEAPAKYVHTIIKNKTNKNVELTVKYPVKGSYGIEVKANDSLKESFPVGTKLYKGNQFTVLKKAVYTVTAENNNQEFIIKQ
jgi:uncharacterized membrane protein YphA (DoxX/SURF4 family)